MNRVASIDCLKGLVMVLMALDHVRMYLHSEAYLYNPLDIEHTTPIIFLTRFVTHLCAPVFILLAGMSTYIVGDKLHTVRQLSIWLVKRGISLVVIELTLVNFAWYFNVKTDYLLLGILWAMGSSMLLLAGLIYLPKKVLLAVGIVIISGHNLLDGYDEIEYSVLGISWFALHLSDEIFINGFGVFNAYPILPTLGILILGYSIGPILKWSTQERIRVLGVAGLSMLVAFVLIRGFTEFGDYWPWEEYDTYIQTALSFIDVHKAPASLLYLLLTLGVAALFVAWVESKKPIRLSRILNVYGRVPMFYYIVHIFIIHFIALLLAGSSADFTMSDMIITEWMDEDEALIGFGYPLWFVNVITLYVVAMLYPLCQWYYNFKKDRPNNALLRYI